MKSVLFIGNIQYGEEPTGGGVQCKNQILLNYLEGKYVVDFVDTWGCSSVHSLLKSLYKIVTKKCDYIVLSIGMKGCSYILKLLSIGRINLPPVYYFVPGGTFCRNLPRLKYADELMKIDKIFVQSKKQVIQSGNFGFHNVYYCPNFKDVLKIRENCDKTKLKETDIIRFVYIGRLVEEKGIEDIISANNILINRNISNYEIVIYGESTEKYNADSFSKFNNIIFKGFLNLTNRKSYDELSKCSVLVFPSYFIGEGFPGTIIDAFICGMPVIATRHNVNEEIVNESNGLLVNVNSPKEIADAMELLITNKKILYSKSENAFQTALIYDTNNVLNKIFEV